MSFEKTTDALRSALNRGPQGRENASNTLDRTENTIFGVLESDNAKEHWETKLLRDSEGKVVAIETPFGEARVVRRNYLSEEGTFAKAVIEKKLEDKHGNAYWKPVWSLEGTSRGYSRVGGDNTDVEFDPNFHLGEVMRAAADIIIAIGRCTE
ncbi:hypothetical protein WDS10_003421 [Pseudomonas aeruginosa]|nr:hypothetical protein [Pseudomonas aeruginosa]HCH6926602.1 hypothetical protein [Pseudomonas aeruginosa]